MPSNFRYLNCFGNGVNDEEKAFDQMAAVKPLISDEEDSCCSSDGEESWDSFKTVDIESQLQKNVKLNPKNRRELADTFVERDSTGAILNTQLKRNRAKLKLNYVLLVVWRCIKKGFLLVVPGFTAMFLITPSSNLFREMARSYQDVDHKTSVQWI